MMRSQGKYFSEYEVNKITALLHDTDLTVAEIANRMSCSRSAVAAINRKFQIRVYGGKRSEWRVNIETTDEQHGSSGFTDIGQKIIDRKSYKCSASTS